MLDIQIIEKIKSLLLFKNLNYKITNDVCYELDLTNQKQLNYGLLRNICLTNKNKILKLICKLENLTDLNLSHNLINDEDIKNNDFFNLKKLKTLNLSSNNLTLIPNFIKKIKTLKSLNVGGNLITEIFSDIEECNQLENLWLHKNIGIKNLQNLQSLQNLKLLNLYFINLLKMPIYFNKFKRLNSLTLWNTNKFLFDLNFFEKLEYFTVCGSRQLIDFPPGLCKIKRLKMVRLYQNNIKNIPSDISDLKNLEQLSLYQNDISNIEPLIFLNKIKKLNLGWNNIKEIPEEIFNLKKLKWLGVFQNPLQNLNFVNKNKNLEILTVRPFNSYQII